MIIIVGPSASGKTSVAKELTIKYGFKKFVTSTTRAPRNKEINGVDYNFITFDTFKKKISQNDFIEYTFYNGNYYGSERKQIDQNTVIIVESNGLKAFKNLNIDHIVSYFLDINEETRIKRMEERGDSKETIRERIIHDRYKFDSSLLSYIDKVIKCENKSIEDISKEIYDDYSSRINKK